MKSVDPELLAAVAELPAAFGPVWSGPSNNLAAIAGHLGNEAERVDSFRRALKEGYFTQYTAYSDPEFAERVVDWQLNELAAIGLALSDLPASLVESRLVRPETLAEREGRRLSPDFVRYLYYAQQLQRHSVLARPRSRILEIGSGYGGMGRVLKHLVPGATLFLADLPSSLVYAYLFLASEFPEARLVVAKPGGTPDAYADADFVFVPVHRAECLKGLSFDLAMNIWSFGEIPNEYLQRWFDLLQTGANVDWLFLLNSFLKRIEPQSAAELEFGNWPSRLDENWRVADFAIDPRIHRCPYVTNFPNGVGVLARRIQTATELDRERDKARAEFDAIGKADWIAAQASPDSAAAFIETSHHVGRWHLEPGMSGSVFRCWQQYRLNGDERAVRTLLAQLAIARGHGGNHYRFKDEFFWRALIAPAETARERTDFFREETRGETVVEWGFTVQEACDHATVLRNAGNADRAEALYQQILRIVPGHGDCLFQLGAIEEGRGEPAQALDLYARAFNLAPENPNYRERVLRVSAELTRHDPAQIALKAALAACNYRRSA